MYSITIKERLQQYVKQKFGEYKAFELKAGLAPGSMSNSSEPSGIALQKVLETCPDLSPDWLIMGMGKMERHSKSELLNGSAAQLHTDLKVAEPTKPYQSSEEKLVTIPASLLDSLRQQLENKDAQIATLLQIMNK